MEDTAAKFRYRQKKPSKFTPSFHLHLKTNPPKPRGYKKYKYLAGEFTRR